MLQKKNNSNHGNILYRRLRDNTNEKAIIDAWGGLTQPIYNRLRAAAVIIPSHPAQKVRMSPVVPGGYRCISARPTITITTAKNECEGEDNRRWSIRTAVEPHSRITTDAVF